MSTAMYIVSPSSWGHPLHLVGMSKFEATLIRGFQELVCYKLSASFHLWISRNYLLQIISFIPLLICLDWCLKLQAIWLGLPWHVGWFGIGEIMSVFTSPWFPWIELHSLLVITWLSSINSPNMAPKKAQLAKKIWKPPDTGKAKANFDKAIFDELNEASIAVAAWNSQGEIMVALSEKITKPSLVIMLESLAARRATLFVQEPSMTPSSREI